MGRPYPTCRTPVWAQIPLAQKTLPTTLPGGPRPAGMGSPTPGSLFFMAGALHSLVPCYGLVVAMPTSPKTGSPVSLVLMMLSSSGYPPGEYLLSTDRMRACRKASRPCAGVVFTVV